MNCFNPPRKIHFFPPIFIFIIRGLIISLDFPKYIVVLQSVLLSFLNIIWPSIRSQKKARALFEFPAAQHIFNWVLASLKSLLNLIQLSTFCINCVNIIKIIIVFWEKSEEWTLTSPLLTLFFKIIFFFVFASYCLLVPLPYCFSWHYKGYLTEGK